MPSYGTAHQRKRAMLLPNAIGKPCPRCGRVMLHDQVLELDHGDDYAEDGYLGIVHRHCNRKAGGNVGKARLIAKKKADKARKWMGITACAIGVEISEDRLHTSIGMAAYRDGEDGALVELLAYLDGTQSAVGDIWARAEELPVRAIVIDPRSQAATLIRPLELAKLKGLLQPTTSDVVVAHGRFLDELAAGRIRHVDHPRLNEAARAGTQRRLSGAQTWDRRNPVDVGPLTAVTLALWGLWVAPGPKPPLTVL